MKPDESIPTRQSLLERLKHWSDQESWQTFFNRYWKFIYNAALQAGLSEPEAQEVVQDTVLSVARNIDGFSYDPAVCSFKTWMLRVTRWRILKQLQRRQHDPSLQESSEALEELPGLAGPDLEAIWEEEWQRHVYGIALEEIKAKVSPLQIQMFDLYVNEGWPTRKVAHCLGVSTAQVYLAKYRIGRMLKKEIHKLEQSEL